MTFKKVIVSTITFLILFNVSNAQAIELQSGAERIGFVELYTSEGCSSCPPADKWFSQLRKHKALWTDYVPVAFHVTYWDYLGWQDKFASEHYSARQRTYATIWNARNVYTPSIVFNGERWREWAHQKTPPPSEGMNPGNLRVSSLGNNQFEIQFEPTDKKTKNWRISLAVLGFDYDTVVGAGENYGKNLKHDFVVLSVASGALQYAKGVWKGDVSLNVPKELSSSTLGLAAWVSIGHNPKPVQAVGGYL